MRDCRRAAPRQNANRDRGARSLRTRDVQQSRANQTTGRSLEENARRSKRRNGRSNYGRRRFFRIQPTTGPFDSCGQFSCRRGGPGENRGIKKAGGAAAADFAFEQVRTRAGTNDSHRNGGDDRGGARLDEEVTFKKRDRSVVDSDRAARIFSLTPAFRPV